MKENKDLIKLLVVVFLLFLTGVVNCQTKEPLHSTLHKDAIEQEDEVRYMVITVSEKKDNLVYFYRDTAKKVEVSMLFWDDQSVYHDPMVKPPYTFKGCYMALTCSLHKYIYVLSRTPCVEMRIGGFFFEKK